MQPALGYKHFKEECNLVQRNKKAAFYKDIALIVDQSHNNSNLRLWCKRYEFSRHSVNSHRLVNAAEGF